MSKYRKAIMAAVAGTAAWFATAFLDGNISGAEIAGLAVVVLGVFGVYQVPNDPS